MSGDALGCRCGITHSRRSDLAAPVVGGNGLWTTKNRHRPHSGPHQEGATAEGRAGNQRRPAHVGQCFIIPAFGVTEGPCDTQRRLDRASTVAIKGRSETVRQLQCGAEVAWLPSNRFPSAPVTTASSPCGERTLGKPRGSDANEAGVRDQVGGPDRTEILRQGGRQPASFYRP
jgi:hypothetical protein